MKFIYCRHELRDWETIQRIVKKTRPNRIDEIIVTQDPRQALKEARTNERVVMVSGLYHYRRNGAEMDGHELSRKVKKVDPLAIFILMTSLSHRIPELLEDTNFDAVVYSGEKSGPEIIADIFSRDGRRVTLPALRADFFVFNR